MIQSASIQRYWKPKRSVISIASLKVCGSLVTAILAFCSSSVSFLVLIFSGIPNSPFPQQWLSVRYSGQVPVILQSWISHNPLLPPPNVVKSSNLVGLDASLSSFVSKPLGSLDCTGRVRNGPPTGFNKRPESVFLPSRTATSEQE
jgi:hypothetical protein